MAQTGFASISWLTPAMAVLATAFVVAGAVALAIAGYLLLLSIAALFYSEKSPLRPAGTHLLVLVPAHDEADLIARCVGSLRAQRYPADLYKIAVVADNCTDGTAEIATAAGADIVLVREEPDARGKGRALRWAMDRLLATEVADAVVIVDADSIAAPDFLIKLVQPLQAGAPAVQGESLLYENGSRGTALRAAAFLLVNRVRPAGRAVLGLPGTHLAGNGMLLATDLLASHPWAAFTSAEDLEYSLDLQMEGLKIAFAGGAVLRSPAAPHAQAAAQQQLRWEGGKVYLARTRIPKLVAAALRDRRPVLLGVAFDLAVPPLGFLAAIVLGGLLAGAGLASTGSLSVWALAPWLLAAVSIALFVMIGLRAAGATRSAYRALLGAPLFILTKPLRTFRVLSFQGDTWVRTDRGPETEAGSEP